MIKCVSKCEFLTAVWSAAAQLKKQFPILQAAPENGHFVAELDTFFSLANCVDESINRLLEERYSSALSFDYCSIVEEPSLDEVARRYRPLIEHVENLSRFTPAGLKAWLRDACRLSADLVGAVDWLVSAVAGDLNAAPCNGAAIPDFGHRLSPVGLENGTLGLLDTVNMAADKLLATVNMLSDHFAIDDDENRPSDETVFFALQSIKCEALDIKAVMGAFHAT